MPFSSLVDDPRLIEILKLALTLEGAPSERIQPLLEFVRSRLLKDAEAILLTQNHFDFSAQRIRPGLVQEAVRNDVDVGFLRELRKPAFRRCLDDAFLTLARRIVGDVGATTSGWICQAAAPPGVDIEAMKHELLHPLGVRDIWTAAKNFGDGSLVFVSVPTFINARGLTEDQMRTVEKLPRLLAPIANDHPVAASKPAAGSGLSAAQSRVLDYALTGLPEKEIAHRLHRSPHTISSHLRVIYRHYNVTSRVELLAKALGGKLKGRSGP